jgi:hypothetical protein
MRLVKPQEFIPPSGGGFSHVADFSQIDGVRVTD